MASYQQRFGTFGKMSEPLPHSYRRIVDLETINIGIIIGKWLLAKDTLLSTPAVLPGSETHHCRRPNSPKNYA